MSRPDSPSARPPARSARLDRRTVVRGGVVTAWTVPLVLHGVPARALACSAVAAAELTAQGDGFPQGFGVAPFTKRVRVQLCNAAGAGDATGIVLTATLISSTPAMTLTKLAVLRDGDGDTVIEDPLIVSLGANELSLTLLPVVDDVPAGGCLILPVEYTLPDAKGTHTVRLSFTALCSDTVSLDFSSTIDDD